MNGTMKGYYSVMGGPAGLASRYEEAVERVEGALELTTPAKPLNGRVWDGRNLSLAEAVDSFQCKLS